MVNNSDTKVSYQGNGQTTVFPFSFPFIQRDYIKVAIYDSLTDETKTIDSDYYVDTVANTVIYPGYEPGQEPAEALRPPILPATSTITIYRQTDVDQLTDLGEKYPLKDIENMADKLTEIIQEQAETLGRTVKVPVGDPKTPEEKLTDLQNYVSDAANSAKNAADSEASAQRAAEAAETSAANAAESERLASGYADTASDAASRAEDSAISARAYNAPEYDNAKTYQAGDVVTYIDGNSYRALQETTGHEPPNIIYWQKVTDYVGDDFFEVDEYGYIVPMDSPSHSRYWRVDQNGYIVPIEGGDGGYRPDTRSLSSEYLNVTNEGYIKHLRADDINAQEVDADEVTAEVAEFTTLTANAVNAGTLTADDIIAKGPVVDVRAFGAVGDGVTDDTEAIQAAIDNGRDIFIPAGIYCISRGLTVNRITKIRMSPKATIKVIADIDCAITLGVSGDYEDYQNVFGFKKYGAFDGVIDCNNKANIGIKVQYSYHSVLENLKVGYFKDTGILISGGNNGGVKINKCVIWGKDGNSNYGVYDDGFDNEVTSTSVINCTTGYVGRNTHYCNCTAWLDERGVYNDSIAYYNLSHCTYDICTADTMSIAFKIASNASSRISNATIINNNSVHTVNNDMTVLYGEDSSSKCFYSNILVIVAEAYQYMNQDFIVKGSCFRELENGCTDSPLIANFSDTNDGITASRQSIDCNIVTRVTMTSGSVTIPAWGNKTILNNIPRRYMAKNFITNIIVYNGSDWVGVSLENIGNALRLTNDTGSAITITRIHACDIENYAY